MLKRSKLPPPNKHFIEGEQATCSANFSFALGLYARCIFKIIPIQTPIKMRCQGNMFPVKSGLDYFSLFNAIHGFDGQNHFNVFFRAALAKHGVLAVQVGDILFVAINDKELAAARVFAGVGHGEGAKLMCMRVALCFALNFPPRVARAGQALRSFTGIGAPSLYDKMWYDPVEGQAIIEAIFNQLYEVGHRAGGLVWKKFKVDFALACSQTRLCHSVLPLLA
jgi:hypothetical protein